MRLSAAPVLLVGGILLFAMVIKPFTGYMGNKPMVEKLGFVPSIKLIRPLAADQKELAGASLVMKVLMYYGGIVGKAQSGQVITEGADLAGMSRILHGAVLLDPYNMDAYYFAQGFLTWDAGQIKVANELLEYGMQYRTWDWYLPYFAGFNYAYFLKDYAKAADYYQKAAALTNNSLFTNLAARYMQESGRTQLAISYLEAMVKNELNPTLKRSYGIRLAAFKEVQRIEVARDVWLKQHGSLPTGLEQLLQAGLLSPAPQDPYGGRFYLENDGKVNSTSNFAFTEDKKEKNNGSH